MTETQKIGEGGLRKAAVLLVSLEPELAAKVLEQIGDIGLIEQLSLEIARLQNVGREERDKVLEEFYNLSMAHRFVEQGGVEYAKAMLDKCLPASEVGRVMETIQVSVKESPFGFLGRTGAESLVAFLQEEHPQTLALILAHLTPSQSAGILLGLPGKKQVEVVKRMATMGTTSPEIVAQVGRALKNKMAGVLDEDLRESGGVDIVAEVLNLTDRNTEKTILENLEEEEPDLVGKIRRQMFVFEDVQRISDRGIQALLKSVEREQLALGLRTASPELKEKVFKNMSKNAVILIKEEMEFMGPVRLTDVEGAQHQIMEVARKLAETGDIIISGRGQEDIVV